MVVERQLLVVVDAHHLDGLRHAARVMLMVKSLPSRIEMMSVL